MPRLRIHLLGGFLIDMEGQTLPPIPSTVGRSLFAYLVTYRGLRHTRDLLAGTFWPDRSESSARKRLSQTLWQIQTALQEVPSSGGFLDVRHGTVAFDTTADFWLDVAAFDEHTSAAEGLGVGSERQQRSELDAAVALFRGEFLAGFYEDWTVVERERLRSSYLIALERLVALHKGRADYDTALAFGRRLTLHDPMREDAHQEVMRLCFLLGRPIEALYQYERCAAILAEELGSEPTAQTTELRDHIAQLRDKGERPFAPSHRSPLLDVGRRIPLVGRREERVTALRRLEDALSGRGGVLLIEGEAGIGKTRLLQELANDAQWRGLSILWVECSEGQMLHPLRTLRAAFESGLTRLQAQQLAELLDEVVLVELARIAPAVRHWLPHLPDPARLRPAEERERMSHAVSQTLLALSRLNPTVLFVDDAQWSDAESATALAEIAGQLQDARLLICVAFRSDEARERPELWELLMRLDRSSQPERVMLSALTPSESTLLVEESIATGSVATEVAAELYHETGGNPLFLIETLRARHEENQAIESDWGDSAVPVASGISQVIARRFAGLEVDGRRVLETVAVSSRLGDPAVVAEATGLPRLVVLSAFDELLRRGALVEARDGYDFTHDQVRRVILDGLDPDYRRQLHYDTALAIEHSRPERLEELAYHYTQADAAEQAAHYSIAAGHKALGMAAYDTAAQHFESAAGWGAGMERFDTLGIWEEVLDVLGRREEQCKVIDQMEAAAHTTAAQMETARRRVRLLGYEGRHPEATAIGEAALALNGSKTSRGALQQTLGLILSHSGRPAEAVAHLSAAVSALGENPAAEARARCDLGNVLSAVQRYEEAEKELRRALAVYEELKDRRGVVEAAGELAVLQMEQGDVAGAIELYRHTLRLARDIGYRRREGVTLLNLGNALYFESRVGEALFEYEEAAAVFAAIGDREGEALVRANAAAVRHLILGDLGAEDDLMTSLEFFRDSEHPWGEAFCLEQLAAVARRRGDLDEARRLIEDGLELLAGGKHRWVEVHLIRQAAQIELDAMRPAAAAPMVERALELCRELGLDDVVPTVESLAAVAALQDGDVDDALAHARAATDLLSGAAEQPYVIWYIRHRAASACGEDEEAAEALSEAWRLLNRLVERLEPEVAARALEVPEHRSIHEARNRTWPTCTVVRLPRDDVPLGRALRETDWIEVTWTVSEPNDYGPVDKAETRRRRIVRLVGEARAQGAAPRVEDLATVIEVSVATVRRDLASLRSAGHRLHTRGSR